MSRYIDADAIIEFIDLGHYRNPLELCYSEQYVVDMIESRPTADVVEVVRCKDCTHYKDLLLGQPATAFGCNVHNWFSGEDDYCSFGERRQP